MNERTWQISDIDGTNTRTVTLAQYRAEIDAQKALAANVMKAVKRGDLRAYAAAQAAMRGSK